MSESAKRHVGQWLSNEQWGSNAKCVSISHSDLVDVAKYVRALEEELANRLIDREAAELLVKIESFNTYTQEWKSLAKYVRRLEKMAGVSS